VYHYLDDLVSSENFDDPVRQIREVLSWLKEAGLTVKPSKVRFATTQLSFLGHIVSTMEYPSILIEYRLFAIFRLPRM
jgi:hypothetical protein